MDESYLCFRIPQIHEECQLGFTVHRYPLRKGQNVAPSSKQEENHTVAKWGQSISKQEENHTVAKWGQSSFQEKEFLTTK